MFLFYFPTHKSSLRVLEIQIFFAAINVCEFELKILCQKSLHFIFELLMHKQY